LLAAWFGFLITFLNLLPAWQLDGGHIARATFGVKWHRILTYASIGILFSTGYYIMGLFVLMFSMRSQDVKPLDDISPLSKNRKRMFALVLALAFLCAPLPFSIFT
jgi:membrane-associated protease RseP (regulator of RpoE activity)